jgi:hypothetical protein
MRSLSKNGKSCGPEGVYIEMLKHGTDKLITMLTWVINRCLMEKKFHNNGKLLTFHQYTKKGSKEDCVVRLKNLKSIFVE